MTHSLRFTSGVTPADFLVASMAAVPISSTYLEPGNGEAQTGDLSLHMGMLYRLSYAGWLVANLLHLPKFLKP